MWLSSLDGSSRRRTIFEQNEIAYPGRRIAAKRAFAVGRPDVKRRSHRLFGPVVEVVAEARPNVTLELDCSFQTAVDHAQEVIGFGRPKKAGDGGETFLDVDARRRYTSLKEQVGDRQRKTIHSARQCS